MRTSQLAGERLTMLCSHCHFDANPSDAVWCGGCGKALRFDDGSKSDGQDTYHLEVRCGQVLVPGAPSHVTLRLTSRLRLASRLSIWIDSPTLKFHQSNAIEVELPPSSSVELRPHSFIAEPGSHVITIHLDDGQHCYVADYHISVGSSSQQLHVHGPVVHNAANNLIGDHTIAMNVAVANSPLGHAQEYAAVTLRRTVHRQGIQRRIFPNATIPPENVNGRRLVVNLEHEGQTISYRLSAGLLHQIGRSRTQADIHIAPHPLDDPLGKSYQEISRVHLSLEFTENGIVATNHSRNGSLLALPSEVTTVLGESARSIVPSRSRIKIASIDVLINCFANSGAMESAAAACWPAIARLSALPKPKSLGPISAVRLERQDGYRNHQRNILFQHSLALGRDPSCAFLLPSAAHVAPRCALIHYLGGLFWLEPCSAESPTKVEKDMIPPYNLIPLSPHMRVHLGPLSLWIADPLTQ